MLEETNSPARRGRPARVEITREDDEQVTRRRRKNGSGVIGQRMGVNESLLDFSRFAYRWINDAPARIYSKTIEDDWDIVHNDGGVKEANADLGNAVSHVVGANKDGSPLRAYLCRKPKTYFDDDQKAKLVDLDRQLAELREGHSRGGEVQSDYIRSGGISID